jgi:heme exporter protein A
MARAMWTVDRSRTPDDMSSDDDRPPRGGTQLTITGLACSRGGRTLFRDVDLALAPGDLVWLRAANGYGKTTLLRAVVGLLEPDAGTIAWPAGKAALYFVAHTNALKGDLPIVESLRHHARLHGSTIDDEKLDMALRRFGLQARRNAPTRALSQGQRRRVALASLAFGDPGATWILDEPYDALDTDGAALVDALLVEHADAGGSVLFTSHVPPTLPPTRLRVLQLDAPGEVAA